jgi:hypothetical protein
LTVIALLVLAAVGLIAKSFLGKETRTNPPGQTKTPSADKKSSDDEP